jgi:hypothetical protein
MSISFYGYVREHRDGELCWTWPTSMNNRLSPEIVPTHGTPEYPAWFNNEIECRNPDYDARLDLNMAERNAQFVLNELGFFDGTNLYNTEPMPIDVFEIGLRETIARNPEAIYGIPGIELNDGHGPRLISYGVRDGYVNLRLAQLLILVEAAREYGATHIGWG